MEQAEEAESRVGEYKKVRENPNYVREGGSVTEAANIEAEEMTRARQAERSRERKLQRQAGSVHTRKAGCERV